jgi:hypothetical protein
MRTLTIAALAIALSTGVAWAADNSASSTAVLNDSQCQSLWGQAATNGDSLSSSEAGSYITDFKRADANNDGKISQAEFNNACKLGLVQSAASGNMPKTETR